MIYTKYNLALILTIDGSVDALFHCVLMISALDVESKGESYTPIVSGLSKAESMGETKRKRREKDL